VIGINTKGRNSAMVGAHKRAAAADKNDFKIRMDKAKEKAYSIAAKKAAMEQKLRDKKLYRTEAARLDAEIFGLSLDAEDEVFPDSSMMKVLTWGGYLAFGVAGLVSSTVSAPSCASGTAPDAAASQEMGASPTPPPRKMDKNTRHMLKGIFGVAGAVVMEDESKIFKNKSSMQAFLHRRLVPGEWELNLERLDKLIQAHLDAGTTGVKGHIVIRS